MTQDRFWGARLWRARTCPPDAVVSLPDGELTTLAIERLTSEGHPADDAEHLAEILLRATTERLVLLVRKVVKPFAGVRSQRIPVDTIRAVMVTREQGALFAWCPQPWSR